MQPSRIQASPNKRIKDGRKLLNINWKYGGSLTSFFEQSFKTLSLRSPTQMKKTMTRKVVMAVISSMTQLTYRMNEKPIMRVAIRYCEKLSLSACSEQCKSP
ncbi:hypothetical protein RRG08_029286 [Elysia crispata]|uniref:Uncharacterized protein n=1 Tax=Elysia crispata TaxID=231223 RepID=A0AAE1DT12_9GAST|nr:hypothetical protein RRG08_029286 [Elysia crispata]